MARAGRERGQAAVEFALIALIVFILTIGLLDVGRAFYQYNALASAARYGARFGGVVGGTCSDTYKPPTADDWCNQDQYASPPAPASCANPPPSTNNYPTFWTIDGNWPCQSTGTACPTSYDSGFNGYYTVSNYTGAGQTSIVGDIATHFDTNSGSSPTSYLSSGNRVPGFDLRQMKVCIQPSYIPAQGVWSFSPGDKIYVFVYYPFSAVGPFFSAKTFNLIASSWYTVE